METHASVRKTSRDASSPRPSPAEIAQRILNAPDKRSIARALPTVRAIAELTAVADETTYELVASVRRDLGRWRTPLAREVKHDLDTILTLYRAEQWQDSNGEQGRSRPEAQA